MEMNDPMIVEDLPTIAATAEDHLRRRITDPGGEDADCFSAGVPIAGVQRGLMAPILHPQSPTAIPYGISASVWKGSRTQPIVFAVLTHRRYQTHDRPEHLRRLFGTNFLADGACFPV
jgi:hypothetical protein